MLQTLTVDMVKVYPWAVLVIRKSGKYYEQAHKKQEVYEQQEVTREKVIDLSNL